MKSAISVLLIVLVGTVLVSGQRRGCPFRGGIAAARARMQRLINMYPELAQEIMDGRLRPNGYNNNNNFNRPNFNDGFNNNQYQQGYNQPLNGVNDQQMRSLLDYLNQQGRQGNLPINNLNQQGGNQLPFNRPLNNGFNGQQGGSLLDNLNGQQSLGNLPVNTLNGQGSLPTNGLQGSQTLNGQTQPSLSTPTVT